MVRKWCLTRRGYGHEPERIDGPQLRFDPTTLSSAILKHRLLCDNILVMQIKSGYPEQRALLERAVKDPRAKSLKAVVLVSDDVDFEDDVELIWGIFTRFDCALDVVFTEQRFVGITPVYSGVMGIDATWKPGLSEAVGDGPGHRASSESEMGGVLGLKKAMRLIIRRCDQLILD